jgi:alkanesulfonate monooxygenase SsuD/methylene tetrahydromethanopterin reductase-like flavin-dependent oxidoreductase (luciferase family)
MSGPAMKIGVQLPEVERPVSWGEVRDIARCIEAVGFDSVWVGDHLLYIDENGSRGPWEAWSQLAALGEITQRVELGPLVAATSFHSPAMIAKKAATVDAISGGRLILGLGAGWNATEYRAFGFPYDNRVSRFEEAFTVIRTLIREGSIDHVGRYYEIREMELLPRARPGMQLMVGSNGAQMLEMTIPHVDLWNTWHVWFGNTPAGLAPLMDDVDDVALRVGRPPGEVKRSAAVLVQLEGGIGRNAGSERSNSPPLTGSFRRIAEEFAAYEEAGIDHLQLVLDPIDTTGVERAAKSVHEYRSFGS